MQNDKVFRIDDPYEFLTRELLEKEYIENKLTDKDIALKYNIGSKATIWRRRKFFGIQNACQNKSNQHAVRNRKFIVTKEDALRWQEEGKTYDEMTSFVGCSKMVLYRRMKELGMVTECHKEMKKLRWHVQLSEVQIKFLLGDLLGDGNIISRGMYQCNHSYKQKSFIEYKQNILSSLMSPSFSLKEHIANNHQNGKKYRCYYLRTMGNETLKKIYNNFYINGVKTFPSKYLTDSIFDARSLAAWYMGDGGRKANNAFLYTYGFGYNGNLDILKFLNYKFGLIGKIAGSECLDRHYDKSYFISFSVIESAKFFQLVAPYLLPMFQYKLPQELRNSQEGMPSDIKE